MRDDVVSTSPLCPKCCLSAVAIRRAHHVPDLGDEYLLLARLVAWSLYLAGFVVLLYLAFEPFVRKRWPAMLIGWARALAGRLGDPVVGRDILIGCVAGVALLGIHWSAVAIGWSLGLEAQPPFDPLPDALGEPRAWVALMLFLPMVAVGNAMGAALLLRLTHMVLRLCWLASGNGREARRLLEKLKAESARRYVSPALPAMIHAALAEDDRAFALLDKPCAAKDPALISIQVGEVGSIHLARARLAALRADPRFDDLLRRMGLDPRPTRAESRADHHQLVATRQHCGGSSRRDG